MTHFLRGAALLFVCLPVFAGGFQQFPLGRTVPLGVTDIAADDGFAWVAPEDATVLTKVDLDGNVTESFDIAAPFGAQAIALDPTDHGVWWADGFSAGVITGAGVQTHWDLAGANEIDVEDLIIGPDDFIWIARETQLVRLSRSGTMQTFNILATGLAAGPDGNVWYASEEGDSIGKITPAGTVTDYPQNVAGEFPLRITKGTDGKLWFTTSTGRVRGITTAGAVVSTFNGGAVLDIAAGEDGLLWWYDATPALKKFNTTTNSVDGTYPVNAAAAPLGPLSASSDGVWWGSEEFRIGRVSYAGATLEKTFRPVAMRPVSLSASATHLWYSAPEDDQAGYMGIDGVDVAYDFEPDSMPGDILAEANDNVQLITTETGRFYRGSSIAGMDAGLQILPNAEPAHFALDSTGDAWITLPETNQVRRLKLTAGLHATYTVPSQEANPTEIVAGPDGNLWMAEADAGAIARITSGGVFTEFPALTTGMKALAFGPDGNLWYSSATKTYTMTTSGVVTVLPYHYPADQRIIGPDGAMWAIAGSTLTRATLDGTIATTTLPAAAGGLTIGPDGKLWFTAPEEHALYRIDPDEPMTAVGKSLCMMSNGSFTGVAASFIDPDETRTAADYSASIQWGDGTSSAGTVVQTAAGHFDVTGSHAYTVDGSTRSVTVTFHAAAGPNRIGGSVNATSTMHGVSVPSQTINDVAGTGETKSTTVFMNGECSWTATSNRSWITFPNGNSGNTTGTLTFQIALNPSSNPRSGTITINGLQVTVNQLPNPNPPGTNLYLITPCRIYDSRNGGVPLNGNSATTKLQAGGRCGISEDALAIAANISVVAPVNNGWLAAYKTGFPWPGVSSVSYRTGRTRATNTMIALNLGSFVVMNGGPSPVHFIVDVTGYFQ
ncbi:MAG TPA: BACON domain-containing carbohydrate-binding protein [Thermoanaerobaculia bacterium]|nr:BACON domain-containing carbohydrate-binding protein [Thermoanaerobaculia bacterium]